MRAALAGAFIILLTLALGLFDEGQMGPAALTFAACILTLVAFGAYQERPGIPDHLAVIPKGCPVEQ
jgi:hypothetical protein